MSWWVLFKPHGECWCFCFSRHEPAWGPDAGSGLSISFMFRGWAFPEHHCSVASLAPRLWPTPQLSSQSPWQASLLRVRPTCAWLSGEALSFKSNLRCHFADLFPLPVSRECSLLIPPARNLGLQLPAPLHTFCACALAWDQKTGGGATEKKQWGFPLNSLRVPVWHLTRGEGRKTAALPHSLLQLKVEGFPYSTLCLHLRSTCGFQIPSDWARESWRKNRKLLAGAVASVSNPSVTIYLSKSSNTGSMQLSSL